MAPPRKKPLAPLTAAQQALVLDPEALAVVEYHADRFAGKYAPVGADEFRSAGHAALVDRAPAYDPAHAVGASFASFATHRVVGAMLDYMRGLMPKGYTRKNSAERKRRGGEVVALVSLSKVVCWNENEHTLRLGDVLADEHTGAPGWAGEGIEALVRLASRASAFAKDVILRYYVYGRTFKEIGAEFGVCEGRVSQIHAEALVFLREHLENRGELPPSRKLAPPSCLARTVMGR